MSSLDSYRRLVGRLIYVTITRSDIAYFVQMLSQLMHKLKREYWVAAIRVLRYFKRSPGQSLFFGSHCDLILRAYCEFVWASYPSTR